MTITVTEVKGYILNGDGSHVYHSRADAQYEANVREAAATINGIANGYNIDEIPEDLAREIAVALATMWGVNLTAAPESLFK